MKKLEELPSDDAILNFLCMDSSVNGRKEVLRLYAAFFVATEIQIFEHGQL
jgi:hypothetical protein